jgi:hypothetical protein
MKAKKTDARFSGYPNFKYHITFRRMETEQYCNIRKWCWETFGASCELQNISRVTNPNMEWCWDSDEWKSRIYLATEKQYQWFLLKWN